MSTQASRTEIALEERFSLKALVEALLLVEEGVCGIKDVELGLMAGAGILPGPLQRADERGLDEVQSALERAADSLSDERFFVPRLLRRLVAQGRLGKQSGQGFFPYPLEPPVEKRDTALLERRGGVALIWLNRPPTNPISPQMIDDLSELFERVDGVERACVFCSTSQFAFSAGADIKQFTQMDQTTQGRELLDKGHDLLKRVERSKTATIACVNAVAYGGGCELAMACDIRLAARSASFGQPEIGLGIIPGFGGTQRLRRLVGHGKALELNLIGDPIDATTAEDLGLANAVVADHELFDAALLWARKLSKQPPIAIEQIKRASQVADLEDGIETEKQGFITAFSSADAREGIEAFLQKRTANFEGR